MKTNIQHLECDDCGAVKPESDFRYLGHTAGGQVNGYDIESNVCAQCGQRSHEQLQADLYESAAAEMAAEDKMTGVSQAREDYRQYIAPLVVGNRWAYWAEQLQADGSLRGFPLEFSRHVKAWRTDQTYIGDEQMTGMVTELEGRRRVTFRSSIVRVSTPTRAQYDAWTATHGEVVSASK